MTHATRRALLTTSAALAALAVFSACGSTAPPGTEPTSTGGRLDALRLEVSGGFTSMGAAFRTVPVVVVTADGQVISPAPVPAVYPGPMLPPMTSRSIDETGRATLADAVLGSGLATSPAPDLGTPNVADAPTTTLTVTVGGSTTTVTAPALGEALGDDPALTPDQRAARDALRTLVEQLGDLPSTVGEEHLGAPAEYRPTGVWLRALPAPTERPPEDPGPTTVPWPVAEVDLASLGTPTLVDGATGAAVLSALDGATELTWFRASGPDGTVYQLLARPALPGDPR